MQYLKDTGSSFLRFGPVLVLLLIATTLYCYRLGAEPLWIDELSSILDAKSLDLSLQSNRPVYFLLLHVWMYFGQSEVWLRSLSCGFGLGSVFLTYCLGRRLFDQATGLIAASLLAFSPLFINHAQEVRMYTVGTFWCLFGTLALSSLLQQFTIQASLVWVGTRLLMFWTTPLNIALILADMLLGYLNFRKQPSKLIQFATCLCLFGLLALPKFLLSFENKGDVLNTWAAAIPKPGVLSIAGMMTRFTFWLGAAAAGPIRFLFALLLVSLITVAIVCKPRISYLRWILIWAFLPQLAVLIVSQMTSSLWIERYMLFTAPYIFLAIANGASKVWRLNRKLILILSILYIFGVSSGLSTYYTTQKHYDWRGVAESIRSQEQPSDTIFIFGLTRPYFSPREKERKVTLFDYYYSGSLTQYQYDSFPSEETLNEREIRAKLKPIFPLPSRSWLVYERTNSFLPIAEREAQHALVESVVHDISQVDQVIHLYGVDVFLLEPPPSISVLDGEL